MYICHKSEVGSFFNFEGQWDYRMPGVPMAGLKLGGRSRQEMKKGRRGKRSVRVGGAEEEKCSAQGQ